MANVIITPNMNLTVPVTGVEPGPAWANDINNSLSIVDGHNHAAGSGVQINPDGIYINDDLSFNNTHNATFVKTIQFFPQVTSISAVPPYLNCIYVAGVDLYYNDGNGDSPIRITQGGAVAGSAGTITGLPSGSASAAFVAATGTFVFQQATSTGANLDVASIAIRYPGSYPTPSGNYIQLQAPTTLSTGYAFTLPAILPSSNGGMLTSSTSGAISYTNVDNSSLQISGGVISVKAKGIIQNDLQLRPTGSTVGAGGYATSGSINFNTTSTSLTPITGASITITTTGRPVYITFLPDPANPTTTAEVQLNNTGNGSTDARFAFFNGSTQLNLSRLNSFYAATYSNFQVEFPPTILTHIDTPAAGTYTYTCQTILNTSGGGTISLSNMIMVAYEL